MENLTDRMDFATPFSAFSNSATDRRFEFICRFYVQAMRSFEERVVRRLGSINLPRPLHTEDPDDCMELPLEVGDKICL